MGRTLLMVGLALAALWLVLTVARVAVGGLLWVILIAAAVLIVVGLVQRMRTPSDRSGTSTGSRARTPV